MPGGPHMQEIKYVTVMVLLENDTVCINVLVYVKVIHAFTYFFTNYTSQSRFFSLLSLVFASLSIPYANMAKISSDFMAI